MTDFNDIITAFSSRKSGTHTVEAPATWSQGRTLYGGMSAALCYVAARSVSETELPIRSAMFSFVGPSGGVVRGEAEVMRKGRSTVMAEASLIAPEGIGTRALLAFGAARNSQIRKSILSLPEVSPPDECHSFWKPGAGGPGFSQNFDYKYAGGALPVSGTDQPELIAWVRHKKPVIDGVAGLLALADSLPPAAMAMFQEPAPISTMSWSVEFLSEQVDVADNWFLCLSRAEHTSDGYSSQLMHVWDQDGVPVIAARQQIAIFY